MRQFFLRTASVVLVAAASARAQTHITTPKEQFGANIGDDYFLFNYTQLADYWRKLDRESDRMVVREIGKTSEGRPQLMAIVTSPANHKLLEQYRSISRRLALAEGLTDAQAHALAKQGKAVVWIDGGLHANEVLGAQQLGQIVYEMVSRTDEETMRFLNDVIILFVQSNPDGQELVANWYMRNPVPTERSTNQLPRLYHKYIGHDNNRDFFASTQVETENMNRVLYLEWSPQILYNHHQSGPAGTVVYSPPLRDPYNYNLDPMLILGLQSLGAAMHTRLAREDKPGATMRSGGAYDGWWNGGIRNTATFHNTIAMLTEMIGNPTPTSIPFVAQRQIPGGDLAFPVPPQVWHFKQSIDYSMTLNRAVLDYASRNREDVLYNIYAMGKASIKRGSQDTWTANPRRIAALSTGNGQGASGNGRGGGANDSLVWVRAHAPEFRDPRAYIIPSEQRDFPTATKFINALLEVGISVQRATAPFTVSGKQYPANSFVVFTNQAFRPHVMDMFEAQQHPDVFPYAGAPPTPPYDIAGWTLAYQMGVQFDRILDPFTGPFQKINAWNLTPTGGAVRGPLGNPSFMLSRNSNNATIAVNRVFRTGATVTELVAPTTVGGTRYPVGSFFIMANDSTRAMLTKTATDLGVTFDAVITRQAIDAAPIKAPRIGLWDTYGGSMPAGWTRWILEQFEFPFARVFAPEVDAGNLNAKYDAMVFVSGGIPAAGAGQGGGRGGRGGGAGGQNAPPANLPAEYQNQFGSMSAARSLPAIKSFIENGGTVVAIGSSAMNLAAYLQLPVEDHLVENGAPLPNTKFFIPGSVLAAHVDTTRSEAAGMAPSTDFFFDDSPVMKLGADAAQRGVTPIAWFDTGTPLRSGWAWGQNYLQNGVIAAEAKVGKGRVLLYTPEILQRAQPHATFKLLFNALLDSTLR